MEIKEMKDNSIYRIKGDLDSVTSVAEQQGILELIGRCSHIAIHLGGCNYVSSAGLRVMLHACKTARKKGGQVDLIEVSEEVREVMNITGFDRFFAYYSTEEDYLRS